MMPLGDQVKIAGIPTFRMKSSHPVSGPNIHLTSDRFTSHATRHDLVEVNHRSKIWRRHTLVFWVTFAQPSYDHTQLTAPHQLRPLFLLQPRLPKVSRGSVCPPQRRQTGRWCPSCWFPRPPRAGRDRSSSCQSPSRDRMEEHLRQSSFYEKDSQRLPNRIGRIITSIIRPDRREPRQSSPIQMGSQFGRDMG